MAQWIRASQVCEKFPGTFERISNEFQKLMNIEVRFWMADWMESNIVQKKISTCQNPERFYVSFLDELKQRCDLTTDACLRNLFTDTLTKIENDYEFNGGKFYIDLCDYMKFEMCLCDQLEAEHSQQTNFDFGEFCDSYRNMRIWLKPKTNNEYNHKAQMDRIQDLLRNIQNDHPKLASATMDATRWYLPLLIYLDVEELHCIIHEFVTDVLENNLKNSQYKYIETRQLENQFKNVQGWFEDVFEALDKAISQFNFMPRFVDGFFKFNDARSNLIPDCPSILNKLICHSLVFQQQPELVIRKDTQFEVCVRLLIGKYVKDQMPNIKVKVQLISAEVAQQIFETDAVLEPNELHAGNLVNNEEALTYNESTNAYTAHFETLKIRSRPQSTESNEEYLERQNYLLATVGIGYNSIKYQVYQLSSPIVVTVHNSQYSIASATALLHAAFYNPNDPFSKVEKGSWRNLAETLNAKFKKDTGRGLTDENLAFLYKKLTAEQNFQLDPDSTVTCSQVAKVKLQPVQFVMAEKHRFTFWEYVYEVLQLIVQSASVKSMWENGFIQGFVDKSDAASKLSTCRDGTFILRFSDYTLGGISIAYVQKGIVQQLVPYIRKDLEVFDLVTRLNQFQELKFIYPDIPKEKIKEFQSKQATRSNNSNDVYPIYTALFPTASESSENLEEMMDLFNID